MTDKKVTITETMVQRIEDALEERKNKIDRRAQPGPANLGSEERRRYRGRRKNDNA